MTGLLADTWLILRNDLRLFWRDARTGRFQALASAALIISLGLVLHLVATLMFWVMRRPPPLEAEAFAWFFVGFVMLGAAMNNAVTVLFERADFDLLLSSPVSTRAILLARLCAMIGAAAATVALFLVPVLNGAVIGRSPHYLYGYLVWLLVAITVTCVGVWFTLVLVRWLGARRARTWAQVIAALLGATVYIAFQIHNALPPDIRGAMAAGTVRIFASPGFTIIARAGRGEWLPLLTLASLAITTALITTRVLNRIFVTGIQEAGQGVTRRRQRRPYRLVDGLIRATFLKDVRLIIRDPLLLSRVLPSVFYLVPVLFPLHRVGNAGAAGLLGPFAVIATVTLSSQLTAVAASGEEGWDLIRLSPASTVTLRVAKMAAGMALPCVFAGIIAIVVAVLGRPGLAVLALTLSVLCATGSCWLEVASMRPTPRKDLIQRRSRTRRAFRTSRVIAMLAFLGVGTAAVVLAAHELWWFSAAAFGVVVLADIACFTLVEMKDIEFEAATPSSRPS